MTESQTQPPETHPALGAIEVSILIEARPETVYSILSEPTRFGEWMQASRASFEPRVGSPFELHFPQYGTVVSGEVLVASPGRHLAFSWGVLEGPQDIPPGSSRVDIRLIPDGASTRVELTHSDLPNEQEIENHTKGWQFHLSRLAVLGNKAFLSAVLEGLVGAFFGAWNERDPEVRSRLLGECCVQEVRFSDEFADIHGLDHLSTHIGIAQNLMAGTMVEVDGPFKTLRGEVLIPFRIVNDHGEVLHRGVDHAVVSSEGKLVRVTGFWEA